MKDKLRKFAFWFVLALVGQAVALQMIYAGPRIHYQHYRSFSWLLTKTHPLLLIFLMGQAFIVFMGLRIIWPDIRFWLNHNFKKWHVLVLCLIFFLPCAAVSREIPFYLTEVLFAVFVQAVNLGNILVMVWAFPEDRLVLLKQKFQRFLHPSERKKKIKIFERVDLLPVLGAIWVTVLAAFLAVFIYERHPHIADEVIYLFHAKYFANGMLSVPAPAVPEAFSFYMIPHESLRWYSIFPPGWPAILALGFLLKIPWLVNPILAGFNILLIYVLLVKIFSRNTARLALLLICISPWYIFMGMNFMAHTFTLTCALLASLAMIWARQTGKIKWAFSSGISIGFAFLTRPLDGFILAALLGLWAIGIGGRRLKYSSLVAFVIGAIVVGAIILPYNKVLTGNVTTFPLNAYYEQYFGPNTNALGFGPERGLGWPIDAFQGHSPLESVINANLNIFSINTELLGWSIGSLILIGLFLFSRSMGKSDYLMLAVIIAVIGIYSFYWFSGGPDFGARYWYLALIPLIALTARGIQFLRKNVESNPDGKIIRGNRVIVAVLSLCVFTLLNYIPWRSIDKYHHYLGMRPGILSLAKEHNLKNSLVLIRGDWQPDYMSAWIYNPLDFHSDMPIFAWDKNREVRIKLLKAYNDRPVWIVNGPTITNDGFKVIAGPLSATELIDEDL
jgi:hypothetical protein